MKILLWIGDEANQRALANKINQNFEISGIILERKATKRKITPKRILNKIYEKIFLREIDRAWWGMKDFYEKLFPSYPKNIEILVVENINSSEAFTFSKEINSDLIIVSGTRLVKEEMLSLNPKFGILNLHTGLSPYVKGGPNCTNWCIANMQFHLIGNTIMWIDQGIDSGNIVTTEFTPIDGNESLSELHIKVMEHAHDLYLKAIESVKEGKSSNIPQNTIAKGQTYYTKEWTLKTKRLLIKNYPHLYDYFKKGKHIIDRKEENIKEFKI